jgi:hypothetical protein
VEKEDAMATEEISLKPIVNLIKRKKRKLAGVKKFVSVEGKKAIDSRIQILNKVEDLVESACAGSSISAKNTGAGVSVSSPPLSIVVKGK